MTYFQLLRKYAAPYVEPPEVYRSGPRVREQPQYTTRVWRKSGPNMDPESYEMCDTCEGHGWLRGVGMCSDCSGKGHLPSKQAAIDPEEMAARRLNLAVEMGRRAAATEHSVPLDQVEVRGVRVNPAYDPSHNSQTCEYCQDKNKQGEWSMDHWEKDHSHQVRLRWPMSEKERNLPQYRGSATHWDDLWNVSADKEIPPLYHSVDLAAKEEPHFKWGV